MINKLRKALKGFTLIETMVAILLLTTAIAGPLTIASKGLTAALVARDQITAFYLAQDAVEYVRFTRDTDKLAGASWLAGLEDCFGSDGCRIDTLAPSITACAGSCPPMGYDLLNHYFNYTSPVTPQNFVRTVKITTPIGGNASEAALTVSVSWTDIAGVTHMPIIVKEELFDWQ